MTRGYKIFIIFAVFNGKRRFSGRKAPFGYFLPRAPVIFLIAGGERGFGEWMGGYSPRAAYNAAQNVAAKTAATP